MQSDGELKSQLENFHKDPSISSEKNPLLFFDSFYCWVDIFHEIANWGCIIEDPQFKSLSHAVNILCS